MLSIPNIYASRNYKLLIAIPATLLIISLLLIYSRGVPQGIDLRGGILITTETNSSVNAEALKSSLLSELGVGEASVKTAPGTSGGTGIEVEIEQNQDLASAEIGLRKFYDAYVKFGKADYEVVRISSALDDGNVTDRARLESELAAARADRDVQRAEMDSQAATIAQGVRPFIGSINITQGEESGALKNKLATAYADAKSAYRNRVLSVLRENLQFNEFTYKDVSPSLSEFFLQKTIQVITVSFILTTIVVLIVFRSLVPSFAVIFGAFNDMVFALGAMSLFGIPLTLASVGALLMLMGFSLDTDMLLTIRILKRTEGHPSDRAYGAMKTGVLMTLTSIAAFGLLFILSMITQLPTYYQIAAVVLCGLVGDLIATWCTNAVIVLWAAENREKA